ncbi:MAG: GFA family protein [Parasphingorhabdus sp.]|uniref:GFA family protein n=1 Tax=Parasphingorhabdus sp. TaxID=2709688 RepID=UPI003299D460
MTMTGQCLCGSVSYDVSGEPQMTGVCHCKNCQRQSGSAYSVLFGVTNDQLSIQGDLTTYEDSSETGNVVERHFCGKCGSPLLSTLPTQPGMTFVKAGTLDDTSHLNPQVHFWTKSSQDWVTIDPNVPQMEGNPG